jgi:ABC-type enterobactin transport system permease subunit
MNRHERLEWDKVQASWKLTLKNWGHSMKRKELAVNRMLLVMIKRRANTFFMIVQRKVLKAAEVFATTVKRWSQGKKLNQKITLLTWRLPRALSF